MGPACVGDVVYLNEPAVLTEIRGTNASFQRTQLDHYLDSILSIEKSFYTPLKLEILATRKKEFELFRGLAVRNLTRAFLLNTLTIKRTGELGMCSEVNISVPVTAKNVLPIFYRNKALRYFRIRDVILILLSTMPKGFLFFLEKHIPWFKLMERLLRGETTFKRLLKNSLG